MKFTKEKMEYVIKKWKDTSIKDIAKELNVSEGTIYKWTYEFIKVGGTMPIRTVQSGPKLKRDEAFKSLMQ